MDYQFSTDDYGRPAAEFSLGHEAIGLWLCEELSDDSKKIDVLLSVIDRLEAREIHQFQQQGSDLELRLSREQVEVIATALEQEFEARDSLPEDTDFYDQESYAECGFQDFKQVLIGWREYIASLR